MNLNLINKCLNLSSEIKDLCSHATIPEINGSVTAIEFHRDWVSPNLPVLFKGAISNWPATRFWELDYLRDTLGDKVVSVAVTPNGYADAIAKTAKGCEYFVEPEERRIPLSQCIDILKNPESQAGIFYIQKQDSNLTSEFPELVNDIEPDIPWATKAFGSKPAAVNLWIGDKRAVTSMHKDPFENLYCVVSGHKDFVLLPPTDRPWIPYKKFPLASYKETAPGTFDIIPKPVQPEDCNSTDFEPTDQVPWICIDPLNPDFDRFPLYRNASPIRVRVAAGDVLYLPSLWFHHVQQSHACIAVNYWYDMKFDIKYAYFQFLESLSQDFHK